MAATVFRCEEKRYRDWRGRPLAELVEALGVTDLADNHSQRSRSSKTADAHDAVRGAVHLAGCEVPAYTLTTPCPGVYVLPGVLDVVAQAALFAACVTEYPNGNATNLHPHTDPPPPGPWAAYERGEITAAELARLRWTTLGAHYDWTAKVYPQDRRGVFPPTLAALVTDRVLGPLARAAALAGTDVARRAAAYVPEAAIVNYYRPGDTLMAHTDHAEEDHEAPLVSVSVGLPAVFLVGGPTRDVAPAAVVLRSGDAIVMDGPSRLCYHGVPLVLAEPVPVALIEALAALPTDGGVDRAALLAEHARHTRVNVNVRQVLRRQPPRAPS